MHAQRPRRQRDPRHKRQARVQTHAYFEGTEAVTKSTVRHFLYQRQYAWPSVRFFSTPASHSSIRRAHAANPSAASPILPSRNASDSGDAAPSRSTNPQSSAIGAPQHQDRPSTKPASQIGRIARSRLYTITTARRSDRRLRSIRRPMPPLPAMPASTWRPRPSRCVLFSAQRRRRQHHRRASLQCG